MIVTAALAWYDEQPEDLDRYVRHLPIACDRLVAMDGGYAGYPGASHRSPREQEAALHDAARDIGLPAILTGPDKVWAGQVEKRNHLYQLAAKDSDWFFTLDADHLLHGPREPFRHELEHLAEDSVDVAFYTTPNYTKPLSETAATSWHENLNGELIYTRLLYRVLPGLRLERRHWLVSAMKGSERMWLCPGTDTSYNHAPAHQLEAPLLVEHRCMYRRERNILANRSFCEDRVAILAETGQEDMVAA